MKAGLTLYKFLQRKDQRGFVLALGYYVQLDRDAAGMSPAIESETKEMVMVVDIQVLKHVCRTLPPREFKLCTQLLYVNPETGKAYAIFGPDKRSAERATQFQILTVERFDRLVRKKEPFKWGPLTYGGPEQKINSQAFRMAINKLPKSRFTNG